MMQKGLAIPRTKKSRRTPMSPRRPEGFIDAMGLWRSEWSDGSERRAGSDFLKHVRSRLDANDRSRNFRAQSSHGRDELKRESGLLE
jgi:hypothetical protein